ncbi:MAG TPA: Ran-binding zinc finger domain-containing protein [Burkholderiaceae bacterium]|nr:Ran-binding zinc finger domain-containing protein [Burkholderiaceae bacterium]
MKTPNYRWVCYKCSTVNEPGTQVCLSCGFPSNASGHDIAALSQEPKGSAARESPSVVARNAFLFFPEVIVAAVVVLGTPVWFVHLLLEGAVFPALALAGGVSSSTVLFVLGYRRNATYSAYLGMAGVLFTAWLINSWVH